MLLTPRLRFTGNNAFTDDEDSGLHGIELGAEDVAQVGDAGSVLTINGASAEGVAIAESASNSVTASDELEAARPGGKDSVSPVNDTLAQGEAESVSDSMTASDELAAVRPGGKDSVSAVNDTLVQDEAEPATKSVTVADELADACRGDDFLAVNTIVNTTLDNK